MLSLNRTPNVICHPQPIALNIKYITEFKHTIIRVNGNTAVACRIPGSSIPIRIGCTAMFIRSISSGQNLIDGVIKLPYNGMSYSEIEEILLINRQSIRNHMYRGMVTLRTVLDNNIMKLAISVSYFCFNISLNTF